MKKSHKTIAIPMRKRKAVLESKNRKINFNKNVIFSSSICNKDILKTTCLPNLCKEKEVKFLGLAEKTKITIKSKES